MPSLGTTSAFHLPERLTAKNDPALIGADEEHFAAIGESLARTTAQLQTQLEGERRKPAHPGQQALERDLEVHRLSSRLRLLRRFGLDMCLGRMVYADTDEPVYIGRFGLTGDDGRQLLVDWRAPAAEPFFAATHAQPMGLVSRRRYRWTNRRVSDYWDEAFTADALASGAALDDESAFIASLGSSRSPRMRDVLSTIQSDQDAIIRAGSRGALVVDGGPGTGKTVVALHRAAYLLYADPRLQAGRGGVLFVGPHQPYLAYVDDVLPSLGEEGVQICTLRELLPQGADAGVEHDSRVAALKASAALEAAVEPAVALYEEPPAQALLVETPWAEAWLTPEDWADAFSAAEAGATHNDARDQVWEELLDILLAGHGELDVSPTQLRRQLARNETLGRAFAKAWPLLSPEVVVADLFTVPAYLRRCAPWLTADEVTTLQREDGRAWTTSDLPLLDAARLRVGDPEQNRVRRRREVTLAEQREQMDRVVDEIIAADDSELGEVRMLRGADAQHSLVDEALLPALDPDALAGPFAHVIVDEAQELTDAEWQMLLRRCPSRSFTIVGDRAQARHGFSESWTERLERIGFRDVHMASLTVNYRTPEEVMAEAEPVIRAAIPDANVPTSVRSSGVGVHHGSVAELGGIVAQWLAAHEEGIACVISPEGRPVEWAAGTDRVRMLTPETAKGLEFDLVVLIDPDRFGDGITGAVDRYVAMTRATQRLAILTS
ncbi:RNA polymerase recycling motor ATPase HelR [Microbacterium invictum]|uniref:DNA helicase IV n=1 Tax=Microbacterium invictum TaxID=515415 RepID=A0AA40VNA8_9MICO|nr:MULTISPECIES: RNA polymerase recycling motor ATPase HelR [Microbacterium]MBB4140717.1 DNA helicase IV [Microbacterium invictum]